MIFMVVPCINNIKFFIVQQLMHTDYIKMWISKTFKIITVAPTCFGLYKPSSGSHKHYLAKMLAKYCLWLPDVGLYRPKHVGTTVIILNVLIIHILI
jgi:hypothetical protein